MSIKFWSLFFSPQCINFTIITTVMIKKSCTNTKKDKLSNLLDSVFTKSYLFYLSQKTTCLEWPHDSVKLYTDYTVTRMDTEIQALLTWIDRRYLHILVRLRRPAVLWREMWTESRDAGGWLTRPPWGDQIWRQLPSASGQPPDCLFPCLKTEQNISWTNNHTIYCKWREQAKLNLWWPSDVIWLQWS